MKGRSLWGRAQFSLAGLREAWRRERSFRDLVVAGAVALVLLALVGARDVEWALVGLALAVALGMELVNGALEALADRLHPEQHRDVGAAKDMASGAVFLANCALGGLTVWVVARHLF
ncbi:MAG TPA: diacylglycerol kinase [Novosphingobium sp.]|nr:diacylglycerol kinase [Novosphingobium sp.]